MQNEFLTDIKPFIKSYSILEPLNTGVQADVKTANEIKAVIFDIYGTLIISTSGDLDKSTVSVSNLTIALKKAGYNWFDSYAENNYGNSLLELFNKTVNEHQNILIKKGHPYPEVDIIKVWEQCMDIALKNKWIHSSKNSNIKTLTVVFEILSNPVWPMPNMTEVLNTLQANNIPLGIVSNAQFYTPIIMNYFISGAIDASENIQGFDADISVFSYKLLRSKPDTQLFQTLAEQLNKKFNLLPHQVLFVGNDMLKDVWTANEIGFKTALFAEDTRSLRMREEDDRCNNLKPTFVITHLEQLFTILNIK